MIKYLVSLTEAGGLADAERRGWTRLAKDRFASAEKDDVRLVWRFRQMIPAPGVTAFVRSGDFPEEPRERDDVGNLVYPDAADFDEFVRGGHARWGE